MSAVPAVLVTILIFMDQQITAVILNRKEYKLQVSRGQGTGSTSQWGGSKSWLGPMEAARGEQNPKLAREVGPCP